MSSPAGREDAETLAPAVTWGVPMRLARDIGRVAERGQLPNINAHHTAQPFGGSPPEEAELARLGGPVTVPRQNK